jgi:glyoxylase-like metal-dependent hydrolase (beta-lactamase superfamily II)
VKRARAVVSGDTLVDLGSEPTMDAWLPAGVTHEEAAARLRRLLERPVELALLTHGGPVDRAVLERALA